VNCTSTDRPSAVLLCAGASSRMGSPKATLPLGSRTVVEAHLDRLRPVCGELVVVVGAWESAVRAVLPPDVTVVANPDWATTSPVDSLRVGLSTAGSSAFVVPVDTPPAHQDTLRALLRAGPPATPVDGAGNPGHPVLIGAEIIERVRSGAVAGGLRTLLVRRSWVVVADPWVAFDFDDPTEWGRFVADWDG